MIDQSHHLSTSFPGGAGQGSDNGVDPSVKGPFVYFIPKDQICGTPQSMGSASPQTIQIYQPPAAPARFIGLSKPTPAYLTTASVGDDGLLSAILVGKFGTRGVAIHNFL